MTGLFLLVAGVILPRSILNRKNCDTPQPTLAIASPNPTISIVTPTPTASC